MTCAVIQSLFGCGSLTSSHLYQEGERETLEFSFEYEMSASNNMSNTIRETAILDAELLDAASSNNTKAVRGALRVGADPNVTAPGRGPALHLATLHGNVEMMKLLLRAGAHPNMLDEHDRSALHLACSQALPGGLNYEGIELLLKSGAKCNIGTSPLPLHHCIMQGSSRALKMLIEHGAKVDMFAHVSYFSPPVTPLGLAIKQDNCNELVSTLIEAGANTNRVLLNTEGNLLCATILEAALLERKPATLVKYLISNGFTPAGRELLAGNRLIKFRSKTFRRSIVGLLLRLVVDQVYDLATAEEMIDLLEASEYDLKEDQFCRLLLKSMPPTSTFPHTELSNSLPPQQLLEVSNAFHWGGIDTLPVDVVNYFNDLRHKLKGPPEVPSLVVLCRKRIRSRLSQVNPGCVIRAAVEELAVPGILKKFIALDYSS